MKTVLAALSLSGVALLAAAPAPASPVFATDVHSGDKVTGTIEPATDVDYFHLDLPDGAILTASVKALKSPLLPAVRVFGPDGEEISVNVVLVGEGFSWVHFDNLGVHASGTYTVAVSGSGGSSGAYLAVLGRIVLPKVLATVTVGAGQTVDVPFTADDGALAGFTVVETSGAGLAGASLVSPGGDGIPATDATRKGSKLILKKLALADGPGRYAVRLVGSGSGPTEASVKTTVKIARSKPRKIGLGVEPRPVSMDPTSGIDSEAFTIAGTGFVEGSRVVFGDSDEGTQIEINSATAIQGVTPLSDATDFGGSLAVSVVNPDGQFGTLNQTFTFFGIPRPGSAAPLVSPTAGGGTVVVGGAGFRSGLSVEVDGVAATDVQFLSATTLSFTVPAHGVGAVEIVVKDEYGRPGADPVDFWYADAPSVTLASPSTVPSFGGETVALTGDGFTPGTRIFVGGTEASGVQVQPMTGISFTCPPALAGIVQVEVRDTLDRSWSGPLLTMTKSLQDVSVTALPSPPAGTQFFGNTLAVGNLAGDAAPEILLVTDVLKASQQAGQTAPGSFLLLNGGAATFTDGTSGWTGVFGGNLDDGQGSSASIGDLDGDGDKDVLLTKKDPLVETSKKVFYQGYPAYYAVAWPSDLDTPTQKATQFLANGGTGAFTNVTASKIPATGAPALKLGERWQAAGSALGDLDGDGDLDVLLAAGGQVNNAPITGVTWIYKSVYYYYYYYQVKDVGLFTWTSTQKTGLRPLINNGSGTFSARTGPSPVTSPGGVVLDDFRGQRVLLGDLDGDASHDLDAVVLTTTPMSRNGASGPETAPALRLFENTSGTGTFTFRPAWVPEPLATTQPASLEFWQGGAAALGDLDGDGDLDLVLGRPTVTYFTDIGGIKRVLPAIRIFRNNGSGTLAEDTGGFLASALFQTGGPATVLGVTGIAVADLDGDGDKDLVLTGKQTTVSDAGNGYGPNGVLTSGTRSATRVLLNDGSGVFSDATDSWLFWQAGDAFAADAVSAVDLDKDGDLDLVLAADATPVLGGRPLRILLSR